MSRLFFSVVILLASCSGAFAQKHELQANIDCEAVEVNCQADIHQELTVVTSPTVFYRMFPEYDSRDNCHLPRIDFNRYFLVCVRPRWLGGCKEPKISLRLNWEEKKNLSVDVQITEYGKCYRLWQDAFWVKIPKSFYTETLDFRILKEVKAISQD